MTATMVQRRYRECVYRAGLLGTGAFIMLLVHLFSTDTFPLPQNYNITDIKCSNVFNQASSQTFKINNDGSVEITYKLPATSDLAKSMTKKHVVEEPKNYTTSVPSAKPSVKSSNQTSQSKKTLYPLTLDTPYLINNVKLCRGVNKPILVIVHTAPDHFSRRRYIRSTWANKKLIREGGIRVVFLFGTTQKKETQVMIENESVVYGDIVQGDFLDSYHNLTHKGVLAYRWITEHCPDIELLVKVDDDMFVNIFLLLEQYLPLYKSKSRFMSCQVRGKGSSPILRGRSKWQVSNDEFKNMSHYPVTYCNGFFVIMSSAIVRELYRAAFMTPFFWVDDVYLYGLLPFKIGRVEYINISPNLTLAQNQGIKCFTGNKTCHLIGANVSQDGIMEKLWYAAIDMFKHLAVKYLPKELLAV